MFGNWTGARTGAPSSQSDILSGDPPWSPKAQRQSELEMLTASMEAKIQLQNHWLRRGTLVLISRKNPKKTPKNTMIFWHILSSKIPKHDFGANMSISNILQNSNILKQMHQKYGGCWRIMSTERMDVWRISKTFFVTGYVKPEKRSHPGFLDLSSWLRLHEFHGDFLHGNLGNPMNQSHQSIPLWNDGFLAQKISTSCCHPKKHTYAIHSLVICSIAMERSTIFHG